jgi:hypothetical protein
VKNISRKYNIQTIDMDTIGYYTSDKQNYFSKMLKDTKKLYDMQLFPNACYPDPFFLSYSLSGLF